jgi:hypothetical protein
MSVVSPTPLVGYERRKSSSLNKKMTLPRIEHPSKRMIDGYRSLLDVRGRSTDGQPDGKLTQNDLSTLESPRSQQESPSFKTDSKPTKYSEYLNDIPENIDTVYGEDRNKVRLPVFGKKEITVCFFIFKNKKLNF